MTILLFYISSIVNVLSVNSNLFKYKNNSINLQSKYCVKYIKDYFSINDGKYFVVLINENDVQIPFQTTFGRVVLKYDFEVNKNYTELELLAAESYILLLEKTSLEQVLYFLRQKCSWNNKANFIISNNQEENITQVKNLFNKYKITDFIYCQVDKILKKNKNNIAKKTTLRILPIFANPYIYHTDQGDLTGLEYKILTTIKEKLKFKTTFLKNKFHTWGFKQDNGEYSHMFGQLQNFDADVIMGVCPMNFSHFTDFDVCFPYMYEMITWVVPKANLLPQWKKIVTVFSVSLMICLSLSTLILSIIIYTMCKYILKHEFSPYKNFLSTLSITFSIYSAVSVFRQPKTLPIRILFILLTMAIVLLGVVYQSKLTSILTQPLYDKQISNIEELLQSDLKLGLNLNIHSAFNNKTNIKEYEIFKRSENCDLSLKCLNRTAFKKDFAVTKAKKIIEIALLKYYTEKDGTELIYFFKNPLMYLYIGTFFFKGHPLYEQYNKYCKILFESGFIEKWFEDLKWETKIKLRLTDRPRNISVSLKHISGTFLVLFAGHGLSIIIFFFEIIYYKYMNKLCNII